MKKIRIAIFIAGAIAIALVTVGTLVYVIHSFQKQISELSYQLSNTQQLNQLVFSEHLKTVRQLNKIKHDNKRCQTNKHLLKKNYDLLQPDYDLVNSKLMTFNVNFKRNNCMLVCDR